MTEQNGIEQNGTDKMVLDKMVQTKWYGQNVTDKMFHLLACRGTDKKRKAEGLSLLARL